MKEASLHERTQRLQEQCAAEMLEVVQPVLERHAIPINISYTHEGASKLSQLREEIVPFDAIAAHLTSGKAEVVRLGFEIPQLEHRICVVTLRYEDARLTVEYDELAQELMNRR